MASPHKPTNPAMEVLEDPDEGSKLRGPVMDALEDPKVGNNPPESMLKDPLTGLIRLISIGSS